MRLARDSPEQRGPPVALPNRLTRCTAQCARGVLDASARDYPASRRGPAILLQFAHPLVARGIADHSAFRSERWCCARRLHRTLEAMLQLCFGTEREALAAAARINATHDHVHGRLSHAAGIFPKGTPYSAHDPALLAWVHATLLEMNLRAYELFVGPLTLPSRPTSDRRKRGQFRGSYHGSTGSSLIRCDREQSPLESLNLGAGSVLGLHPMRRRLSKVVYRNAPWPMRIAISTKYSER